MTEELNEREKASAGTGEGSFHSGVGMFLQRPLGLMEELPETGSFLTSREHTLLHLK